MFSFVWDGTRLTALEAWDCGGVLYVSFSSYLLILYPILGPGI